MALNLDSNDKQLLRRGGVGTYGCAGGAGGEGRIVRVGAAKGVERPPLAATVDCPACGERHQVRLTWRQPTERDQGIEPEVLVGAEESK